MTADPSLGNKFPGLKMRNYAATATCLRQTTLFTDTHVLAFIASQWAMFDIFICDEKKQSILTFSLESHPPAGLRYLKIERRAAAKRNVKGIQSKLNDRCHSWNLMHTRSSSPESSLFLFYTLFALLDPFILGHTSIITSEHHVGRF